MRIEVGNQQPEDRSGGADRAEKGRGLPFVAGSQEARPGRTGRRGAAWVAAPAAPCPADGGEPSQMTLRVGVRLYDRRKSRPEDSPTFRVSY
jgi:hypothetical protein